MSEINTISGGLCWYGQDKCEHDNFRLRRFRTTNVRGLVGFWKRSIWTDQFIFESSSLQSSTNNFSYEPSRRISCFVCSKNDFLGPSNISGQQTQQTSNRQTILEILESPLDT